MRGAARGIAPLLPQSRDGLSAKPRPPAAHPALRAGRDAEGVLLFGYFLLHEQEKVTRPPGRRTKHTRTRVGYRKAQQSRPSRNLGLEHIRSIIRQPRA